MATTTFGETEAAGPPGRAEKGLKAGALGLISSTVIGVASTAPAYSLAATLGFVIIAVNYEPIAPIAALLAFIPMLLISFAYRELNKADPDCGTTFTWAARAFGPRTGWQGGWGIVAADILVMASLAQVAGQYVFLLFGANGIGKNATSPWVLLVGIVWIVVMTYICFRGIEVSANFQKALLGIELTMLTILSITALVKVGTGHAPPGHLTPTLSWFNPFNSTFTAFMAGFTLMLFIYWGWDTTVAVNEETADPSRTPGRAAVLSTVVLLVTYVLVIMSAQSFAGVGQHGIGLGNSDHTNDVLSVLGTSIFGSTGLGWFLTKLLLLMVLTSAAASTQTTILPTARTTLSMAVYKSIPKAFAWIHKRHLTPTFSTLFMGAVSILLYVSLNFLSGGNIITDSVSALGVFIAFYYGLTGFACFWYYRRELTENAHNLWFRGILPLLGGIILWLCIIFNLWYYWKPVNSYTTWTMPFPPHWHMGGVFLIDVVTIIVGIVLMVLYARIRPPYFRGEVLNADTPTMVPEDAGLPIGIMDDALHPDAPRG
jgi:amino acid transporter